MVPGRKSEGWRKFLEKVSWSRPEGMSSGVKQRVPVREQQRESWGSWPLIHRGSGRERLEMDERWDRKEEGVGEATGSFIYDAKVGACVAEIVGRARSLEERRPSG